MNNNNKMQTFFDERASSWDSHEKMTQEQLKELLSILPIKEGMKVIDLACGTGIVTDILFNMSKTKVLGIDISSKMIEKAKEKISKAHATFIVEDFLTTNFSNFDFIVIFNAYPHFLDVDILARSLSKTLNNNGCFAIVHSLGREQLEKTHSGPVNNLSRSLLPVEEESKKFNNLFNILHAEEGKNFYYILGQKKSDI